MVCAGESVREGKKMFFFMCFFFEKKQRSVLRELGGTAATGRNMSDVVSSQGKQLWHATLHGNLPEVRALLSKPDARSFVDWKNADWVNVPRRLPLSLLLCCVSVNILDYIST
jgi:hypothetical protein